MSDDGGSANSAVSNSVKRLSPAAVRTLYETHGRDLLTFLMGVLRNFDAAQDVCQATFQRLMEVGHEARTETIRGWLFKVGFHEAMAYRRKLPREGALQIDSADRGEDPEAWGVSLQSLVRAEEIAKLKELLPRLPPEQQFVVRRRIHDDKAFVAIADELNVPLGTVLTRMRLAIQKLQKWFAEGN